MAIGIAGTSTRRSNCLRRRAFLCTGKLEQYGEGNCDGNDGFCISGPSKNAGFFGKGFHPIAVPHKPGTGGFRVAITVISWTASFDEHEIQNRDLRHTRDKIAWGDLERTVNDWIEFEQAID